MQGATSKSKAARWQSKAPAVKDLLGYWRDWHSPDAGGRHFLIEYNDEFNSTMLLNSDAPCRLEGWDLHCWLGQDAKGWRATLSSSKSQLMWDDGTIWERHPHQGD